MTELLTAAQMKAIEAAAMASGRVTGLELMERAGAGVVAAVLAEWPELALRSQRAVVLCGPGNNGGDGFVVARLLAEMGWTVEVYLFGDAEKLPPDARLNHDRWAEVGPVRPLFHGNHAVCPVFKADILFDALFGIGLSRPFDSSSVPFAAVLEEIYEAQRNMFTGGSGSSVDAVVSIDIASGLCANSGRWLGPPDVPMLEPDLTVTFHRAKPGHYLADGALGKLVVAEIGPLGSGGGYLHLLRGPTISQLSKGGGGHKFSHGHALIVSGDHGQAGAARLAARAALRMGAGLVTVASPLGAMAENAARLDAVMLKPVADAEGLAVVLADARINALCLGPGMGVARAAALLPVAVRAKHTPYLVLDADALTAVGQDPALFSMLNDRCVLTPHGGEFARLFPDIAAKLAAPAVTAPAYSKVDATREAAARAGCVVLFKGPDTVIAAPDGRCAISSAGYDRAAPWLATAGSGDVLAGFITGLLARGFAPFDAACTGAWLHVECARQFGPGLIAEDLADQLPAVFRQMGV